MNLRSLFPMVFYRKCIHSEPFTYELVRERIYHSRMSLSSVLYSILLFFFGFHSVQSNLFHRYKLAFRIKFIIFTFNARVLADWEFCAAIANNQALFSSLYHFRCHYEIYINEFHVIPCHSNFKFILHKFQFPNWKQLLICSQIQFY